MDSGAPSSIGGTSSAAALCGALGIDLDLRPPDLDFIHGWGPKMHDAKPVCASWNLPVRQTDGSTSFFKLHLVQGDEPLIIGEDVTKNCMVDNIKNLLHVRQANNSYCTYHTYYTEGEGRRRLSVVPPPQYGPKSAMANVCSYLATSADYLSKLGPAKFAHSVHRYSHATVEEMKRICSMAGILDSTLSRALDDTVAQCEICCRTGRPKTSRKVSLSHIGDAFNQSVQVDFFFPKIRGITRTVLHMRDRGTGYSEIEAVPTRDLDDAATSFDRTWISRHGAPATVSGDPEFNHFAFKNLLKSHDVKFEARPARRHNKVGTVERKNAVLRLILQRLLLQCPDTTVSSLIARANFLGNLFSGSKVASSFEQARGYSPGLCGIRHSIVPPELIEAHQEQVASRALQRLLSSKSPQLLTPDALPKGTKIWALLKSGDWEQLVVSEALQYYVVARRNGKGSPLNIAYEDIRLHPKSTFNQHLLNTELHQTPLVSEDVGGAVSRVQPDSPLHPENNGTSPSNTAPSQPTTPRTVRVPSFLAFKRGTGDVEKDIGATVSSEHPQHGSKLASDEQHVLTSIEDVIGTSQISASKLRFAPDWVMQKSFGKEMDNWNGVYEEVQEDTVPLNANVIRSHTVFKIKKDENGVLSLKSRIVAHGNEDRDKDTVRKDSAAAQFVVIRLLLSIATLLGFRLGKIDVKKAYLQSGPITRQIFVRPPREWHTMSANAPRSSRMILWKLRKLPYGIVEAGRQWHLVAESWLMETLKFERISGLSQIFIKRDDAGHIFLIVAKVIDDFLIAGNLESIKLFIAKAKKQFEIGTVVVDGKIKFNGSEIVQNARGSTILSMKEYSSRILPINLSRTRKTQVDSVATPDELREYQHLAGVLNFLGKGALPHASFVTSYMLQKIAPLKVSGINTANAMLKEISKLSPVISFLAPKQKESIEPFLCTFSDAAYNISSKNCYGQTGIFTGIAIPDGASVLFHPLDWNSSKQRRVTYSSFGSEILACAEADDRTFGLRSATRLLLDRPTLPSQINVDSRGLFDTLTTLHEGRDYRLRQTVQRIRDSFEGKEFDVLRWIKGSTNVADALTKRNVVLYRLLNDICSDGRLHLNLDQGFELNSRDWC